MYLRPFVIAPIILVALVVFSHGVAGAETPSTCEITGTDDDDVLVGTDGDDIICGLGGDDVLVGGLGDDRLIGGPGDDQLVGGPGADVLRGGDGDDDLAGGDGPDTLWGADGDDLLRGANGSDVLYGGAGGDVVRGGSGSDRLRGGTDDDVCVDSWAKTNALSCEYGTGGDQRPDAVGEALWRLRGNDEVVYRVSIRRACAPDTICHGGELTDVVHVRGDQATSAFGLLSFTPEELFDRAGEAIELGRSATFDQATGLPRSIAGPDVVLIVHELSLRDELREAVDTATREWNERASSTYSYVATTTCTCPDAGAVRIRVADGRATVIEGASLDWAGAAKTIDDHLTDLVKVLDTPSMDVLATFDPTSSSLVSYEVDRVRQVTSDGFALAISEFEVEETVADGEDPADEAAPTLIIVDVGGIEVSSAIAGEVRSLLDSATTAGFTLSGGGFRDPQRQIDLRRVNCGTSDYAIYEMPADQCSPPTAQPGRSQHELGLAIDFTSSGRLITSTADPAFLWLVDNTESFGFHNLAGEPWHWSTTGN